MHMSIRRALGRISPKLCMKRSFVHVPLMIHGKQVHGKEYEVYSHNDEVVQKVSYLPNLQTSVPQVCETAAQGFKEWSRVPVMERLAVLRNVINVLKQRSDEIKQSHLDIGAPQWFANLGIAHIIGQLEFYTDRMATMEGDMHQASSAALALTFQVPIGPVLSITPWNAPIILSGRAISGPLAAGCSVVLKTSEKSPLTSNLLAQAFIDAGVPGNALQVVHVKPGESSNFTDLALSHQAIRKVNFTGSSEVGRHIAITAAKYLKPTLLELGGKNYTIIDMDADFKKSAASVVWSSWAHQGQICMCSDKVYVHESVYDEYCQELVEAARAESQDKDHEISMRYGALADKVSGLVQDALDKGAKVIFGKDSTASPTILQDVNSNMKIDSTETFGPILTVHKYTDKQKLVEQLNKEYSSLHVSIWSNKILDAFDLSKQMEVARVVINGSTVNDEPCIPHGGLKQSGMGRFNSKWGINEFSYLKTVTLN